MASPPDPSSPLCSSFGCSLTALVPYALVPKTALSEATPVQSRTLYPLPHPAGDIDPDASPDTAGSHGCLGTADSYSNFADQDPQVPLYSAALQHPSAYSTLQGSPFLTLALDKLHMVGDCSFL